MGKAQAQIEHPNFETVWAALQDVAERQKETDRRLEEKLGKLGDRFGEMIEHMVMPGLVGKFRELGFMFTKAYPRSVIDDEENAERVMLP